MSAAQPIVTFSAGDPPAEDRPRRGVGAAHLDDAVLRIARSLLRENVDIAYAGYLRGDGFTACLADDTGKVVLGPRFVSFLGWPFSGGLTSARVADTLGLCRYVRVEAGFVTRGIKPFSETPEFGWAMARATTATRALLFSRRPCKDINSEGVRPRVAQILIAGKADGFLGVMPGIAEEALCALEAKLAVYVVGAFGGAAGLLAEALTGAALPDAFKLEFHRKNPVFKRMLKGAAKARCSKVPADKFRQLQGTLKRARIDLSQLRNGLSADDNRELMLTSDIGKVVRLITKGLRKLGHLGRNRDCDDDKQ